MPTPCQRTDLYAQYWGGQRPFPATMGAAVPRSGGGGDGDGGGGRAETERRGRGVDGEQRGEGRERAGRRLRGAARVGRRPGGPGRAGKRTAAHNVRINYNYLCNWAKTYGIRVLHFLAFYFNILQKNPIKIVNP